MVSYAEFLRLFHVSDAKDWAPGLEVRETGVYVVPVPEGGAIAADTPERIALMDHPTSNVDDPVLPLPCGLGALEPFANRYGLRAAVDPFELLDFAKQKAWERARIESAEEGQYYWPIVAAAHSLHAKIKQWHEREDNDAKKVVLRRVLDDLDIALQASRGANLGRRERDSLLRIIAAMLRLLRDKDGGNFLSTAKVIEKMTSDYQLAGVSKRNLEKVFSAAACVADLKP